MNHLRDSEMSVGQPGFIRAQRENKEQAVEAEHAGAHHCAKAKEER